MEEGAGEWSVPVDQALVNRGTADSRQPLLQFHSVHGDNVSLQKGARAAKRGVSFCKGVAFSNRPILVNELVCVKLSEVVTSWSGVLRFGVTNVDPASFRDIELPKFACPDLTSKSGFWCKALPERFSVQGKTLYFSVDEEGNLHYGVNGSYYGIFIPNVNVRCPLWVMFDIYGNCRCIEFLDPNRVPIQIQTFPNLRRSSSNEPDVEVNVIPELNVPEPNPDTIKFHEVHPRKVVLTNGKREATRIGRDYCQAYIFTHRPLTLGERITRHEAVFSGSMAFGLTSCDPTSLPDPNELPSDADNLLDRPEYWTCIKNVAVNPRNEETATFWVTESGEVIFSKNEHEPRTIMFVDVSVPLWAFFDLYGSTVGVKLVSAADLLGRPRPPLSQSPAELAVLTPPLRSSSPEAGRAARHLGVRVQLPPADPAPAAHRRSPQSEPASPPDSNDSSHSLNLADIQERVRLMRQRARDIRDGERALQWEREQLDQLNSRAALAESALTPALLLRTHNNNVGGGGGGGRLRTTAAATDSDDDELIPPLRASPLAQYATPFSLGPLFSTSDHRARSASQLRSSPQASARSSSTGIADSLAPLVARAEALLANMPSPSSLPASLPDHLAQVPTTSAGAPTATALSTAAKAGLHKSESGDAVGAASECVVCMSDRVNAVLYRCGHMCMCFSCAQETLRTTRVCPLCRQMILDVIRCYQS